MKGEVLLGGIVNWEESLMDPWVDSSQGSKRQSLLDLIAGKAIYSDPRRVGTETAVVNASIMAQILQLRAESIQQGHCGLIFWFPNRPRAKYLGP